MAWGAGGIGVAGVAHGPPGPGVLFTSAVGVYGSKGIRRRGVAGFFNGNCLVLGEFAKASGGFRIDHPLDPENRYLQHSFVESPDQLNVYSGTVTTDREGTAVVELPEYFEALNTGFRYQLTVIGGFAQAVVSEEVRDNRFAIATDRPEVKVSWQVGGVRQDTYVRTHPFVVEKEKPEYERGKYLHPEAWGMPEEAGSEYEREAALREAADRAARRSAPSGGAESSD
ncbi:hypothetical protein AB0J57_34715 [Streptomyces sp. NPDC049837]|uniref:hypothetical protein n=1 Tax=Streptomyces sp. NPDC049837 TaxID=3155277 RepID=UPI00342D5FD1